MFTIFLLLFSFTSYALIYKTQDFQSEVFVTYKRGMKINQACLLKLSTCLETLQNKDIKVNMETLKDKTKDEKICLIKGGKIKVLLDTDDKEVPFCEFFFFVVVFLVNFP